MYWAKGTENPETTAWTDASTGAIFDYDKWEPGYVEVRHIKIANEGSLVLKYKVTIMGSNQYVQWNAVNSYSENSNVVESSNYTTYVELNGCVRNGCGTYANTANSTLVVK